MVIKLTKKLQLWTLDDRLEKMPHAGLNFVSLKHLQLDEGLSVAVAAIDVVIHTISASTAVLTAAILLGFSIFA